MARSDESWSWTTQGRNWHRLRSLQVGCLILIEWIGSLAVRNAAVLVRVPKNCQPGKLSLRSLDHKQAIMSRFLKLCGTSLESSEV